MSEGNVGSLCLLKVLIGADYVTVGGCRLASLSIDRELIDVTNKSNMGWRALLATGKKNADIALDGVSINDVGVNLIELCAMSFGSLACWLVDEAGTIAQGTFLVGVFARSGDYNKAEFFSATLHSTALVNSVTPTPPPVIVPMTPAGAISGWFIDPLFNYVVRPPTVTHKVTTFTSQTIS